VPTGDIDRVIANPSHVLVVEDEVRLARAIELYLGQRNFVVRIASNGAEALNRISEIRPDVIIADIMMPVMDGYTLCRRLRAGPLTCTIPILFMTGKDEEVDRIRGLKLGADDYLAKPCDLAEVHHRVKKLLDCVEAALHLPVDMIRVAGRLSETDLMELVQALEMQQKTGALIVKRDDESGTIYLKEGVIIGADLGTSDGREPLVSLLTWKSGDYVFIPDLVPEGLRLTSGIANVVMGQINDKT
jgi:DNA-binding response OmpR family regulator